MRTLLFRLVTLALSSIGAFGQGQFVFNNRVPPDIDAKFLLCVEGRVITPAGSDYTVQLLGGRAGTPVSQLTPLAATDFRSGAAAGYVNPITVTVPGVPGGQLADIWLRFFRGTISSGVFLSYWGPVTTRLGQAPLLPPNLPLGTVPIFVGPLNCPEPSPLVLGILGVGTALWLSRANNRAEQNRRPASRFRTCPPGSKVYGACVSAVSAAVAHSKR